METNKRIVPLDLARGVSVLMLTVIHTLWMYADMDTQENTLLGHIIHFIGKGTPMFLIAMGVSFTISRNQSLKRSFKRGLMLLGMGYLMNFLKFIVPVATGMAPSNFIEAYMDAYGWSRPFSFDNMLFLMETGDILQLAGLSLFFMGVINRFSSSKYVPLILALLIMVATPYVRGFRLGTRGLDYILDLLWGAEWNVYFALFPWFSFILIGVFMGRWFIEKNSDQAFMFNRMLYVGLVFLVAGGVLCLVDFDYHFGDYFHLGTGGAIYLAGFNLILFWIGYLLSSYIRPNRVFDFLTYASKRVTAVYIIQWVLICWGMSIFGFQQLGWLSIVLLIPLVTVVTFLVASQISKLLNYKNKTKANSKAVAT